MDLSSDPIAIIGNAFRLPGGIASEDSLWEAFLQHDTSCMTHAPSSRMKFDFPRENIHCDPASFLVGGWLGSNGVEEFDASFFGFSPGEAETLRPNSRLALELAWEALENAGLPPSSLKGQNISVTIAMGAEDGWDIRRFAEDGPAAFDHNWAQNSDPSAVAGLISRFFDFRGASVTVSGACASGALAMDTGIHSLLSHGSDIAIVGAITTHFTNAPFLWASSVGVLSQSRQCAAFSESADGYVPSEGAVFMILKKSSAALTEQDPIKGFIRSLSIQHNGLTRTLATPSVAAQKSVALRALSAAGISVNDVVLLEGHGTGTVLGDKIELEAIKEVYSGRNSSSPLLLSSSKTLLGHCQAAAAFVGILKVLLCFEHRKVPPHRVRPYSECVHGPIRIPSVVEDLDNSCPAVGTVSTFGFTGTIASIVVQSGPSIPVLRALHSPCFLPFSGRTSESLDANILAVQRWATVTPNCTLTDIAAILSIARDHHPIRKGYVFSTLEEFIGFDFSAGHSTISYPSDPQAMKSSDMTDPDLVHLHSTCISYESGQSIDFSSFHQRGYLSRTLLSTFPLYAFQRRHWMPSRDTICTNIPLPAQSIGRAPERRLSRIGINGVIAAVAAVLPGQNQGSISPTSSIFDVGVNSFNCIELAQNLSHQSFHRINAADLYRLQTIDRIYEHISSSKSNVPDVDAQEEADALIREFSGESDLITKVTSRRRIADAEGVPVTVLLTGATGFLGCHILASLLALPSIQVICPVRGDPLLRLEASFRRFGLDVGLLDEAPSRGSLHAIHTSDLSLPFLGSSRTEYEAMVSNVHLIVHCAWKVDFNVAVAGFRPDIGTTRSLANFCAECAYHPILYFVTSYSTTLNYGTWVPESSLLPDVRIALDQGYAISKLISEHVLYNLHSQNPAAFDLRILRVGQVCGQQKTGIWTMDEMIPMLIAAIPQLGAVLDGMPDVSWIPSDVCADVIREMLEKDSRRPPDKPVPLAVHNIANPTVTAWGDVVQEVVQILGLTDIRLLPLEDYVELVKQHRNSDSTDKPYPHTFRLLPFLMSSLAKGGFPSSYSYLDVLGTAKEINILAECPPVQRPLLQLLLNFITRSSETDKLSLDAVPPVQATPTSPSFGDVYMFGPWSTPVNDEDNDAEYQSTLKGVLSSAERILEKRIKMHASSDTLFYPGGPLQLQLSTFAHQLLTYRRLVTFQRHPPVAVIGYCFGEFAAAVACGFLSELSAIEIICLRAWAIHHVQACSGDGNFTCYEPVCDASHKRSKSHNDADGAMLNVFAPLDVVRKEAMLLSPKVAVAIHAGPNHVVLSGSSDALGQAQGKLNALGLKCKLVNTSIPFHSAEMDSAVHLLSVLMKTTDQGRVVRSLRQWSQPPDTPLFVSGLTGRVVHQTPLTGQYWLRHMREPVLFLETMNTLRELMLGGDSETQPRIFRAVDLGPGATLCSILSRYGWNDMEIAGAKDLLSSRWGSPAQTVVRAHEDINTTTTHHRITEADSLITTEVAAMDSDCTPADLKRESACTEVMCTLFGYELTSDLLHHSIHSLGIDSMGFIRLRKALHARLGFTFPPSAFASDQTLLELLSSMRRML